MSLKTQVLAFRGMIFALIAGVCSSTSGMFVKLTHDVHSLEILIFRDIFQFTTCFLYSWRKGLDWRGHPGERIFILLRCIFGTISLSCWFVSVKMTKFGDAGAIYYSYPAFISVLARVFLKEPFSLFDLLTVLLTVIGIFFISGPHYVRAIFFRDSLDFSHREMIGIILASVACCGISCGNLAIRKLQRTPVPVVVCYFSLFSMIVSLILVPIVDRYVLPEPIEWLWIACTGLFGVLTQVFVTAAFKLEHCGPISVTESFNVIFAFLFQHFVFREKIVWTSGVGALLVVTAVFAIGLRKYIRHRSSEGTVVMATMSSADAESPSSRDLPPPYEPPPVSAFKTRDQGLDFPDPLSCGTK